MTVEEARAETDVVLPWLDEPNFRCFGCSPRNHVGLALQMRRTPEGALRTDVTFTEDYASYPGVVHGGIVGVVVDEIMGDLLALEHGMLAFSISLRTKYLSPLQVGRPYTAEARITRAGDGVIATEADVWSDTGKVHVMATGSYQPIRIEQAEEFMGLHGEDLDRVRHYFDHEIGRT